ncbi:hypothetical protein DITRI_Ditri16bG0112000 [Diplodiscus trichospermus]
MDIYIPFSVRANRARRITFAFVRYKFKSEMMTTIEEGNNRRIKGWHIKVKKASYGWRERRFVRHKHLHFQSIKAVPKTRVEDGSTALRDNRSYKDVTLEKGTGDAD